MNEFADFIPVRNLNTEIYCSINFKCQLEKLDIYQMMVIDEALQHVFGPQHPKYHHLHQIIEEAKDKFSHEYAEECSLNFS